MLLAAPPDKFFALPPTRYMHSLWKRGWTPIAVHHGHKSPTTMCWPELAEKRDINLLPSERNWGQFNIALYLGDMVDLDIEFDITHLLSDLSEQVGWLSSCPIVKTPKGVAVLFFSPELAGKQLQVRDDAGNLLLEVRSGRRYRLIHGEVSGKEYYFLTNDLINSQLTPADLPSVSAESVRKLVELILVMAGCAYSTAQVAAICPAVSHLSEPARISSCSSFSTFQQFKDSILRDANLFNLVFKRHGHTLPNRATAFLCPFHSESNPSAAWDFDRTSGKVIFIDYHRRGDDGRLTYDLVDCYAALKSGELRHISDSQEYVSVLYDLAEEFDVLPEYVCITKRILARYATYIRQLGLKLADQQAVEQVWSLLSRRCLIQKLYGSDVFGDSVRWLADHTDIDIAAVNRAVNLLCILGFIEKTDLHSSTAARRPDRFRLILDTIYAQAKNVYKHLKDAGASSLRKLNQNIAQRVIGAVRTINIFRRQSDAWELAGRLPDWFPANNGTTANPKAKPPQGNAIPITPPLTYPPMGLCCCQVSIR